jgi:hypothetical protein
MDIITKGFLDDFKQNKNLKKMKDNEAFEWFCNYIIINQNLGRESFDLSSVSTGRNAEGIDGIAIIVNGKHCTHSKEVEDLIEMNGYLDVDFIFIQSKTSSSFDNRNILNFTHFTKCFFKESVGINNTPEMKVFIELKDFILSQSKYFSGRNPTCSLYYCSLGNWKEEKSLLDVIENEMQSLENLMIFSETYFHPIDCRKVQNYYRRTKSPMETSFTFEKKVTLNKISDVEVDVALSGVLPFSEFKKVIVDEATDKIRPVFEDNIRDYLLADSNLVNSDIVKTISTGKFDYFSILNNGVTIVAESISGAGSDITIKNYQIVNGCQTSNVLYENRHVKGIEKTEIPVKLIITRDNDVKSQITRATNNQTPVGVEQLEALSEFQKRLELFYIAYKIEDDFKIYYERRTNQYKSKMIDAFRVVTIESQLKSFSAMFLDLPHLVSGHYGMIIKSKGDSVFAKDDCFEPYYISALSYFIMEQLYLADILDRDYKRFRYHILMVFRYLVSREPMPGLNSQKNVSKFIAPFEEIFKNKSFKLFKLAEDIIKREGSGLNFDDRKSPERKSDTDKLVMFVKDLNGVQPDITYYDRSFSQLNLF